MAQQEQASVSPALVESESSAEAQTEHMALAENESELDADADADAELDAEADAEAEMEMEADAQLDATADAEVETEAGVDVDAEVDLDFDLDDPAAIRSFMESHAGVGAEVTAEMKAEVEQMLMQMVKGNGCGSGVTASLVPDWNMHSACNTHDDCYDGKGSYCSWSKSQCDSRFYSNMKSICASKYRYNPLGRGVCYLQAKVYYTAVHKLGKTPFLNARRKSPRCSKRL